MFLVSSSAGLGVPLDLFELLVEAVASSVPCLAEENERVGDDVMSKRKVVDQASSRSAAYRCLHAVTCY